VLQVISSSPGELEPVFAAMLGSATRICEAKFGNLFLREGETFRAVAWHGEPKYVENWRREPLIIKTDDPHSKSLWVASLEDLKNVQENQGRAEGSKKSEKGSKESEKVR
jgi:hypothetical protein